MEYLLRADCWEKSGEADDFGFVFPSMWVSGAKNSMSKCTKIWTYNSV